MMHVVDIGAVRDTLPEAPRCFTVTSPLGAARTLWQLSVLRHQSVSCPRRPFVSLRRAVESLGDRRAHGALLDLGSRRVSAFSFLTLARHSIHGGTTFCARCTPRLSRRPSSMS